MVSIKSLENLIITTLLSPSEIIKTPVGYSINFELNKRKVPLFRNYILCNNLSSHITFDVSTLKGTIKPSIIAEKIIRDWTREGEIIAINPEKLNVNTYLLWICLYGRKSQKHVVIDTDISELLHPTLIELFNQRFSCNLYSNGDFFYIKPFHLILLRAIETKKPVLEIAELNYLVPLNEIDQMLFKLSDQNEEEFLLHGKKTIKTAAFLIFYLLSLLMLTSACAPSKIQKRIDEVEKDNSEKNVELTNKDSTLSTEQLEIIDDLKGNTAQEALSLNELDQREEVKLDKPIKKKSYTDPDELAQQLNYLFYTYHTNKMTGEEFYIEASPYFHERFTSMLPDDKKTIIETFSILQERFISLLNSPIIDIKVTNTEINSRKNEATFYRKYQLENGEEIYYITTLELKDDLWLLTDDRPTPPYEILPNITNELNQD